MSPINLHERVLPLVQMSPINLHERVLPLVQMSPINLNERVLPLIHNYLQVNLESYTRQSSGWNP